MGNSNAERGKPEVIFGVIFLLLSGFLLIMTSRLAEHEQAGLSIRTFPTFIGVGLAILSLLLIAQGVRGIRSVPNEAVPKKRERVNLREIASRPFVLRFIAFGVVGFVYTRIISRVGYVVATPLLIFGAMVIYGEKKWFRLVLVPILVSFVLFHLFRTFFRVPLPRFGLW